MRRVIKPFAVEIRGSGRRPRSDGPASPKWPELDDQPTVTWPSLSEPQSTIVDEHDGVARPLSGEVPHVGRVLPSLEPERPEPPPPAPARRPRRRQLLVDVVLPNIDADALPPLTPETMPVSDNVVPDLKPRRDRQARRQVSRADLPFGHKWRARLPASVRRKKRKEA